MVAETIADDVGDSLSALVLAPSDGAEDREACTDLLGLTDLGATNVVSVTLSQSPAERVERWHREMGDASPRETTIIGTADLAGASSELPDSVAVDALAADAELVDLGMSVARAVGQWTTAPGSTAVCLHSLTALLDAYERDHVLGFVNALNRLGEQEDVYAHHHMDPREHDEATVASFRPLYDFVFEHLPDHGWTVSTAGDATTAPTFRGSTVPPGGRRGPTPGSAPTVPMPYSFDTVLDLVSVARRRTLLYYLKDAEATTLSVDDLVDGVVSRESSIPKRTPPDSREEVVTALRHVHLPKLADVGILDYDPDSGAVRYHENEALEACLQYVETLELG